MSDRGGTSRAQAKVEADAAGLRRLAERHRSYAALSGSARERDSRLRFADYLDRLAVEKDAKAQLDELKRDPLLAKH